MTDSGDNVSGPWRYERLEGPGHWMQLEAPDKVNELLLDFLPHWLFVLGLTTRKAHIYIARHSWLDGSRPILRGTRLVRARRGGVLAFFNDRERPIGWSFYGRLMYEVIVTGRTWTWRASRRRSDSPGYGDGPGGRHRLLRVAAGSGNGQDADRAKLRSGGRPGAEAGGRSGVGGPTLAAHAIGAVLVDVFELYVTPFIVGGGPGRSTVRDPRPLLILVDERRFASGVVSLRYRSG